MFKFQIIFLSLLVGTLQGAEQEVPMDAPAEVQVTKPQKDTLSRTFLIKGYETEPVTVADYTKYKMLEILDFQGPEGDTSPLLTGTIDQVAQMSPWSFPDFITPEIMRYLEDLVTCNTQDDVNIFLNITDRSYLQGDTYPAQDIRKMLTIMLAAHYMDVTNQNFDFRSILDLENSPLDEETIVILAANQLSFKHFVIYSIFDLFSKKIEGIFLKEYKKYVEDKSFENKPLLSFLDKHTMYLKQIADDFSERAKFNKWLRLQITDNFFFKKNIFDLNEKNLIPSQPLDVFMAKIYNEDYIHVYTTEVIPEKHKQSSRFIGQFKFETKQAMTFDIFSKITKPIDTFDSKGVKEIHISKDGKHVIIILTDTKKSLSLSLYKAENDGYKRIAQEDLDKGINVIRNSVQFSNNENKFLIQLSENNSKTKTFIYTINEKNLFKEEIPFDCINPTWSPDNKIIGFYMPNDNNIWIYNTEEKNNKFIPHKKRNKSNNNILFNSNGSLLLNNLSKTEHITPSVWNIKENKSIEVLPFNCTMTEDNEILGQGIKQDPIFIDNTTLLIEAEASRRSYALYTHNIMNKETTFLFKNFKTISMSRYSDTLFSTLDESSKARFYKKFNHSYLKYLSFIDLLFISFCIQDFECFIDNRIVSQHYFSMIFEKFDPRTRTIKETEQDTPTDSIAQNEEAKVQQQPSFIANAGAGAPPKKDLPPLRRFDPTA